MSGTSSSTALTLFLYNPSIANERSPAAITNKPMNPSPILRKFLLPVVLALSAFLISNAYDTVPCIILSGNSDIEHCIDLSKKNRITFGSNSMCISNPKEDHTQDVNLLYSDYHQIRIGDANPTATTSLNQVEIDRISHFRFYSNNKTLTLFSVKSNPYLVKIYNMYGVIVSSAQMSDGDILSLSYLPKGVYVAHGTEEKAQITLKFIIK